MAKPRLKSQFSMDSGETGIALGYMDGIADNISTKQYVDSAVQFAADSLSSIFALAVDAHAQQHPGNWYHVYNWGESYKDYSRVGLPQHRLWKMVTTGSGRNRTVGFTFLPETVPSPLEEELIELGVNEGVHVFTWKAPVMEYGIEVTIRPKLPGVKAMIFVQDGEVIRATEPIETVPGYRTTTGVFSAFYVAWWSGVAPQIYDTEVRPQLEADVITDKTLAAAVRKATRRRRKDIGISAVDADTGRALAMKHMNNNKINYVRRARRKRLDLYGY